MDGATTGSTDGPTTFDGGGAVTRPRARSRNANGVRREGRAAGVGRRDPVTLVASSLMVRSVGLRGQPDAIR
jgi:hypothetical protein